MPDSKASKRLTGRMLLIAALCLCLCITTFAIIYSFVEVKDNTFQTGKVDIEISPERLTKDGEDKENEMFRRFEPGMTVTKNYVVTNNSTCDVYYKVYLTDVTGGLADILDVRILDGNTVLFSGKASKLTRSVEAFGEMAEGAMRNLTIEFHYPESAGNEGQAKELSFKICAEATQTKNNLNKEF
jgi:hypothetical protein